MTATQQHCSSGTGRTQVLFMALELSWRDWKLAFAPGAQTPPRHRQVPARDLAGLLREIAAAKKRFALDEHAAVVSCYEAGRDGFWLHRWLLEQGVVNLVVDAGSIEVSRRRKQAKTDRLDAAMLLSKLIQYRGGERRTWSVVHVPSVTEEDRRQLHRELETLKQERTEHGNRLKGLLAGVGVVLEEVTAEFAPWLEQQRLYDGQALPPELCRRLLREQERWALVQAQIVALEKERGQRLRGEDPSAPWLAKVQRLLQLKAIGPNTAWLLVMELFGWRGFVNRRQLAACVGLTPTPQQSGDQERDRGISKAGNRRVRAALVEVAWLWLRWQPDSKLSRWFAERFATGSSRQRRIGIVAVARRLLIALWRWLEHGEVPAGAVLVDWRQKVKGGQPTAA